MAKPTIVVAGNLGKDPEIIADGKGITFSVAANVGKDMPADWYNCVVWNDYYKNFVTEYLKKGSSIIVTGLQTLKKVGIEKGGYYVNVEVLGLQFGGGGGKKQEDDASEPSPAATEPEVKF